MCVCVCLLICRDNIITSHSPWSPGQHPVQQRTAIVLESLTISIAGDLTELQHLCPSVKEVFLSSNSISDWLEVGFP